MTSTATGPATRSATLRHIDAAAQRHHIDRLAQQPGRPWLHEEVARRLDQRLEWLKSRPQSATLWWPGLGGGEDLIRTRYPDISLQGVEPTASWGRRQAQAPMRTAPAALQTGQSMVWANMVLHWMRDPAPAIAQWHELLLPDGVVVFSALGPQTLKTLSAVYAQQGWGPALAPLVDMHDWGDLLVRQGFTDPVIDQETITLTWDTAASALQELRSLGGNAEPGRFAGLRGARFMKALIDAMQTHCQRDGRIALGFEVVYGHAFKAPLSVAMSANTAISEAKMRQMLFGGRAPSSRPDDSSV